MSSGEVTSGALPALTSTTAPGSGVRSVTANNEPELVGPGATVKAGANSGSAPQYFRLQGDRRRQALGFEIVNLKALQANGKGLVADPPWKAGVSPVDPNGGPWRIPDFLERPGIVYDANFNYAPRDSEGGNNAWIVSERLKAIVECLAPDGSVFSECDTVWSNGEPGPKRWICSIVKIYSGAVDLSLSDNLFPWKLPDGQIGYSVTSLSTLVFRRNILGSAHLFRVFELNHRDTYCDNIFCRDCKITKVTGLKFVGLM
jgi:hypothetical protein